MINPRTFLAGAMLFVPELLLGAVWASGTRLLLLQPSRRPSQHGRRGPSGFQRGSGLSQLRLCLVPGVLSSVDGCLSFGDSGFAPLDRSTGFDHTRIGLDVDH